MKIELDENELEIILDALHERTEALSEIPELASANPMIAEQIAELEDLAADLSEMLHRDNDGCDRKNDAVPDAAAEFIQAGIDAREQVKASSRAAVANDPIDW
jgi:t-SNARE complex subunit (syntaxin)